MDSNEKETNLNETLAQLRESLKNMSIAEPKAANDNLFEFDDTITLSNTLTSSPYANVTIPNGGYTISAGGAGGGPYFTGAGINYPNTIWSSTQSSIINLEGDDADIKIRGQSLCETIQRLEERLNVLVPNPELEKEWDELKELGDKYRSLEAKLKEQGEMWKKLKEMPPPEPLYK